MPVRARRLSQGGRRQQKRTSRDHTGSSQSEPGGCRGAWARFGAGAAPFGRGGESREGHLQATEKEPAGQSPADLRPTPQEAAVKVARGAERGLSPAALCFSAVPAATESCARRSPSSGLASVPQNSRVTGSRRRTG